MASFENAVLSHIGNGRSPFCYIAVYDCLTCRRCRERPNSRSQLLFLFPCRHSECSSSSAITDPSGKWLACDQHHLFAHTFNSGYFEAIFIFHQIEYFKFDIFFACFFIFVENLELLLFPAIWQHRHSDSVHRRSRRERSKLSSPKCRSSRQGSRQRSPGRPPSSPRR